MNTYAANAVKALGALGLGLALAGSVQANNEEIIQRIAPIGQVCVEGDETCGSAAAAPAVAAASGGRSGESIYSSKCTACHGTGVLGAPKFGTNEMALRLEEKGMDTLLTHALNGFNAMPAKGTCTDCSDEEIQAAIEYMLEGS